MKYIQILSSWILGENDSSPQVKVVDENGVNIDGNRFAHADAVTLDDDNDLDTTPTKAIYIGSAGNVKVDMLDGSTVIFKGANAGQIYRLKVKRVYDTDTTASDIVALY